MPGSVPRGETLILNVASKKISVLASSYPFIDFSVAPGGNSLLYETGAGIAEYAPGGEPGRVLIARAEYADMARAGRSRHRAFFPEREKNP